MMQPFEVDDFSGGITDNYLDGPINSYQYADNLQITNNKKLYMRPGSYIRDATNYQIPSGQKRIGRLMGHRGNLLEQSERHVYYHTTVYNELTGPSGNPAFGSNSTANYTSSSFWNMHTFSVSDSFCKPIKIFKDNTDTLQVRTAGLPALANAPIVTRGAAGTGTYIYVFVYYYTYNVEGVIFEDWGATTQVSLSSSASPDANAVSVASIPVIANGSTDNYDTANIKVKVFRTVDGGTVAFYVGQVTNGTTVFSDTVSDATIQANNIPIYTTGGIVDNDTPPPSKFVHVSANNIALYGYVQEDGITYPAKFRQSIPGDPDSCPGSFFDIVEDDLTGISSIRDIFIVFCKGSFYRVEGFFDERGQGGLAHVKVSSNIGCVSSNSIVQTVDGVFFASDVGFHFTDGYNVVRVSELFNDRYKTLVATATQQTNIYGQYDNIENKIWWACQENASSLDNDACYVLDLHWGVKEKASFTTFSNGDSFAPSALCFFNSQMYRADKRGYVFIHDSAYSTDPKVDTLSAASAWLTKTIIYNYKSCAYSFGTKFLRKFVPKIVLSLANISNVSAQINSINDDSTITTSLKEIRYRNNVIWGDTTISWGVASLIWNKIKLVIQKRYFPANGLRCDYKQIQITNAYTVIDNSDNLGTATVDATAKTATLNSAVSNWLPDCVDYFISFENDGYVNQFQISARTATQLTMFDANSLLGSGSFRWLIKGYARRESIGIINYVIHFKTLTPFHRGYRSSESGANIL